MVVTALGLAGTSLRAVIVAGSDGMQNTVAPTDDPGWANVGSSGVYLGNFGGGYWVLTATHVGVPASITFSSGSYTPVAGSAVGLLNGDNSPTDLLLYRIAADPGLPTLTLASTAPGVGANVVTIGSGVNRGTTQLYWNVNDNGNPTGAVGGPAWTWTTLPDATGANASGYAWGAGNTKRHGTNQIAGTGTYDIGTGATTALYGVFDAVGGESQGATGDSGGAVFFKNGSSWELVGIMGAIGTYNSQPSSTAVFGNATYYASVPAYYSAIVTAIPEPSDLAFGAGSLAVLLAFGRGRRRRSRRADPLTSGRSRPSADRG
jgi:hypothetical protein